MQQGNAERVMGTVLKKTGWRRSSLVISTKLFFGTEGRTGPNDKGLSRCVSTVLLYSVASGIIADSVAANTSLKGCTSHWRACR